MRLQRLLTTWVVSVSAFASFGASLAAVAVAKDQFPLLEVAEHLRLIAAWAASGAAAGAVIGIGTGVLSLFLTRQRWRVAVSALVFVAVASLTIGLARIDKAPLWSGLGEAVDYPALPSRSARDEAPNFVLISIDTLRADHLGLYGYERRTSPELDKLARGGVVFETAVSQSPATLRSMASLVTGLYPYVFDREREERARAGPFVGSGFHTIAERLAASGYDTAGFVSNNRLVGSNGFGQGFARWDDQNGMFGVGPAGRSRNVQHVVDPAIDWLREARSPFFLWVHVMDPHHPYEPFVPGSWEDPKGESFLGLRNEYSALTIKQYTDRLTQLMQNPEAFTDRELQFLIGRYDSEILQVDQHLSRLTEALRSRGYDDADTVIAVMSDHGEEFMDHGRLFHAVTLYDEMTHVPLIIRGPGIPPGRRISQQVRLIDVVPTILDLAGVSPAGLDGSSLVSYFGRQKPRSRPALSVRSTKYVSYRTPTRKLVVAFQPYAVEELRWLPVSGLPAMARIAFGRERRPKIGLWHLDTDPGEDRNRIRDSLDEARELYGTLLNHRNEHPLQAVRSDAEPGPPASVVESLRALGYVE